MIDEARLDELQELQPWAHLKGKEEHDELFRLARLGLKAEREATEKEPSK